MPPKRHRLPSVDNPSHCSRDALTQYAQTLAATMFVVSWSTGYVVARAIGPYSDPSPFLAARFGLCALVFLAVCLFRSARFPSARLSITLVLVGALHQGIYACASFWAVEQGLQPALMTLLGTLQPPLTALLAARLYQEHVSLRVSFGLVLGIAGTTIAVWPEGGSDPVALAVVGAAVVAVLAITMGTLLQKGAMQHVAFAPSSCLQYFGGALCAAGWTFVTGSTRTELGQAYAALLIYAVVVLSLLGTSLLIWMVRTGSATRASSLLFLTPPLSAVLVWIFFDEGLSIRRMIGFTIAVVGVFLARRLSARRFDSR